MYLGAICHLHNIWIKDGENEGMNISFTLVCIYNDKLSYSGSK